MPAVTEYLPDPVARLAARLAPYSALLTFAAGFLFDVFTMQRIDAWTDLGFQFGYLLALTVLLILQRRHETGRWIPAGRAARWWPYNVEALHFLYGGLLSAYVVLYFRSSTGARPLVFFALLIAVMILNEAPHIRRAGHQLRLGLYALCVLSFLNYFVPILIGRMGGWVFALALGLSASIVWALSHVLTRFEADARAERRRLFAPAAAVCAAVAVLYVLRLIPPVPLSVQFHGIYHDVVRDAGTYSLVYEAPSVLRFWRRDSRPFSRRPGDRVHYFARVFAPSRFRPRIVTVWEFQRADGEWQVSDRIPLTIVGGRTEGFRTFAYKSNFTPGRWRVTAETEDGRAIATLGFQVVDDTGMDERAWRAVVG